jgi:putative transposase
MKKRFTEEQIVKIINRKNHGESAKALGREIGVSQQTIYLWKKKYKGMTVSEAKKLRELEQENTRLKKLVADLSLDNAMLKEVNSKKW